jgi:alpha-L-arabinofuranosidase
VDEEGRVYLKLVNSSQQSLLIHVQGIGLQCTEILALSSETDAHNSFDCPEQVCPVSITPSEESVLLPRCSLLVLSFRQRLQREE